MDENGIKILPALVYNRGKTYNFRSRTHYDTKL